jgi:hypothetical protein
LNVIKKLASFPPRNDTTAAEVVCAAVVTEAENAAKSLDDPVGFPLLSKAVAQQVISCPTVTGTVGQPKRNLEASIPPETTLRPKPAAASRRRRAAAAASVAMDTTNWQAPLEDVTTPAVNDPFLPKFTSAFVETPSQTNAIFNDGVSYTSPATAPLQSYVSREQDTADPAEDAAEQDT